MNRELYFIPIIARAVERRDPLTALRDALTEIEKLGRGLDFAAGYSNFQRFMAEMVRRWAQERVETLETDAARALIVELATDTVEGSEAERRAALSLINSRPAWRCEHEQLLPEVRMSGEPESTARFLLMRGNNVLGRLAIGVAARRRFAVSIPPGHYALMLDSGLLIWEGKLSDRELIWSVAYPGKALDLAADTGETPLQPTVEETLLGGELILRVFPGLENGSLEIEVR